MDRFLGGRSLYARSRNGGIAAKMKVYLYTGVYSIPPGKNIALFPGKITYAKHTSDGVANEQSWQSSSVVSTYTKGPIRLQSAKQLKPTRNIVCTMIDDHGNKQRLTFEVKGCGKAAVFGHHRRLTVELLDYPMGKQRKGEARSYLTHASVPLKGHQLTEGLRKLVSDWLSALFDGIGPTFLDDNCALDVLAKETAIEGCKAKGQIALNWNPRAMDRNLSEDIYQRLQNLAEATSSYRIASLTDTILAVLEGRESTGRISLKRLVEGGVLPCYPVFNVSPYGPRAWDEDRQVSFVGVLQISDADNANRSNYNVCRRLSEALGEKCDFDELLKAVRDPIVTGSRARDVHQNISVQGTSLYFLGVTNSQIRKEKQCTQS